MKLNNTSLSGLIIIEPVVHEDDRGFFFETYQAKRYEALGIPNFVQDNISHSKHNVIRGLHYQLPHEQGKLIGVINGAIWDVAVDIRFNSPTFGQWFGITLSDENHSQVYVPPGFAHGFCVLSDEADIYYKCTDWYAPESEKGLMWNDEAINIAWPIKNPVLSSKDQNYPSLLDIPHEQLFA